MPRLPTRTALLALACTAAAIPAAGCGGSGPGAGGASSVNAEPPPPPPEVAAAADPAAARFPATGGRTLRQLASSIGGGPSVALATTDYVPGRNRVAFGLFDARGAFVYGPTAVYVARSPGAPALGPFPAPADSLEVRPPFRSETSAGDQVKAVYHADVRLPAPGRWLLLSATRAGGALVGGAEQLVVRRTSPVPAVGDPAPRVHTPTLASAGGDAAAIDTRVPPDDMHDVDLADALGRKPVALLFATPALCRSRVCGPVADVGAQLQTVYGDDVDFLHTEVYVDNDPAKGLRPQLRAFGLTTEPWLFAIDRRGRIAARLEGAFGVDEYREAVEAARRGAG